MSEAAPAPAGSSRDTQHDTLSERAAALLERDILDGTLKPGDRLAIARLASHYGLSQTPLREGLSHLAARGLILAIGQRGFRVAGVSREDLEDITRLRVLIELDGLRRSIEASNDDWEAGIIATLHRFRRAVERAGESFREGSAEIDRLHKEFHTALIAGCNSPRTLQLHSSLYDQAYRYRRVGMSQIPDALDFIAEHQRLADIALSRDINTACGMLERHLNSTLAFVYGTGATAGP